MIKRLIRKILSIFKREKKETKNYEPIIPDHRKEILLNEKRKEDVEELKTAHEIKKKENKLVDVIHESIADKKLVDIEIDNNEVSLFKVNGVYNIATNVLLTGFVETGKLKKGMKANFNQDILKILEIRKDREKIDYLLSGQEGTLEVKTKKFPLIKQGDYLEFD